MDASSAIWLQLTTEKSETFLNMVEGEDQQVRKRKKEGGGGGREKGKGGSRGERTEGERVLDNLIKCGNAIKKPVTLCANLKTKSRGWKDCSFCNMLAVGA